MKNIRRIIFALLITIVCLCLAPTAYAETIDTGTCGAQGNNLTWTLSNEGKLIISGSGAMDNYDEGTAPWFSHRTLISSVTINEGVKGIGSYAFCYCTKLTNVAIPESVTSIGMSAFSSCSSLKNIIIPSGVSSIGYYAFRECSSLTDVTLQEGVQTINAGVFYKCNNLKNVTIPESVTNIGNQAFEDCSSLMSVSIPNGVTSIGTDTFNNCGSLTEVAIPRNVASIGNSAFHGCSSLISVIIPSSVASIKFNAFGNCNSLTAVCYEGTEEQWNELSIDSYNSPLINAHIIYEYNGEAPIIFSVTFDANGGSGAMSGQLSVEGDTVVLRKNSFTREYYTFTGWLDQNGASYAEQATIALTEDLVLAAQWTRSHYVINYDANGGEGTISSKIISAGSALNLPSNSFLPPEGKAFIGWNTKADGSGVAYKAGDSLTPVDDTTLYAQWKETVTISFEPNGGEGEMQPQVVIKGEQSRLNPNYFTRANYGFAGWLDQNGNNYNNLGIITPEEDVVLTAQWTRTRYIVSFDSNGGEGSMSERAVTVDSSTSLPRSGFVAPDGKLFTGWNTKANGSGIGFNSGDSFTPTDDVTFYAQWKEAVSITFAPNGGDGEMQPQTVVKGEETILNRNSFTRTNYSFIGWLDQNENSYADAAAITPMENLSLIAQWRQTSYSIIYNANGDSDSTYKQRVTVGDSFSVLRNPFDVPAGKVFIGWNSNPDGSGSAFRTGETITPTYDMTLYAQWANACTVYYDSNMVNGVVQTQIVPQGIATTLVFQDIVPPAGMSFAGWKEDNSGNIYTKGMSVTLSGDLYLFAQWVENVAINEENFPDSFFRSYVFSNFDWNHDNYLSFDEINAVTQIICPGSIGNSDYETFIWSEGVSVSYPHVNSRISSLKGIEFFSALQQLDCRYNDLNSLDLSSFPSLVSLDCRGNQLDSLDISNCPSLLSLTKSVEPSISAEGIYIYVEFISENGTNLQYDDNVTILSDDSAFAISYTTFPDPVFRSYVSETIDTNQDGILSDEEITSATWIDCSGTEEKRGSIVSLKGIELFSELLMLDCSSNYLQALDLSNNSKLEVLDCSNNHLKKLNIMNNNALTTVWCYYNQLVVLDLTGKTMLEELWCNNNRITNLDTYNAPALKVLWCHDNLLSWLDLSSNISLETLSCAINRMSYLDVSNNTALKTLWCSDNRISELDLSHNPELKTLGCYANRITGLDISKCPALFSLVRASAKTVNDGIARYFDESTEEPVYLLCDDSTALSVALIGNEEFPDPAFRSYVLSNIDNNGDGILSSIEIEKTTYISCSNREIASLEGIEFFTALTTLYCESNELTELDLSDFRTLKALYCNSNWLSSLKLQGCKSLTTLYCSNNDLTSLDLTDCEALLTLDCAGNILLNLDLRTNNALKTLNCSNNLLTVIDLTCNEALSSLSCSGNMLVVLDLSGNANLKSLSCNDNMLNGLNLSKNITLATLYCSGNQITDLDLSGCINLRTVRCSGNKIMNLAFDEDASITTLDCSNNIINDLRLGDTSRMRSLLCNGNQLRTLNLKDAEVLTTLNCQGNELTDLDVNGCTVLKSLLSHANKLTKLDICDCAALMTLINSTEPVIQNGIVTYGGSYSTSAVLSFDDGVLINDKVPSPDFILPSQLTRIEDEAFTGCTFIYVKLPEQVVSIGWHAFADCPKLAYIYIPEATTDIDQDAFGELQSLTIIGVPGTTANSYALEHKFSFLPLP